MRRAYHSFSTNNFTIIIQFKHFLLRKNWKSSLEKYSQSIRYISRYFWSGPRQEENLYEKFNENRELEQTRKEMLVTLENLHQNGVALFVDNREVLPYEAVMQVVREESVYMADYVAGDPGKIAQVRFDKVKA